MDNFSLLDAKIAEFYNLSDDQLPIDVNKYFNVNKVTLNWQEIGCLLRQELQLTESYNGNAADFTNLKYENFKLRPIYVQSSCVLHNNVDELFHFQWLGANAAFMQALLKTVTIAGETSNFENILLLTAMLEYALGNIFFTKTGGKYPPHLLRDLLSTDELLEIFGWEAIWFLKILLGSPQSINLRNIVWHGFLQPAELPRHYVAALIVTINTLGDTLCMQRLTPVQRPQLTELTRYLPKIRIALSDTEDILAAAHNALLNCSWLNGEQKKYWHQLLLYLKNRNYWRFVLLVLPQIELLLRLIYASANCYDVRAKLDNYYITVDTIFATHVPALDARLNILLQPDNSRSCNESCLHLMYDLFVAPHGPRIRDKVSHGEVTLVCLDNMTLCNILLMISMQLMSEQKTFFNYESIFHLNSMTKQSIMDAKRSWLLLLQLQQTRPQILQNVSNSKTCLKNTYTRRLQIFQRPKKEAELMQLLLKTSQLFTQTCTNYKDSVSARLLLLQQRELRSKRRKTLEKMLQTLPEICETLSRILCSVEDLFQNLEQFDDAQIYSADNFEKNRRFCKQTLQVAENFIKYSAIDSNEWIKALELCKRFDEIRTSFEDFKCIYKSRTQSIASMIVRYQKLLKLSMWLLLLQFCHGLRAMHIPKDVEILDGYEFDDSPEYYPTDVNYYEARSLLSGLHKSIRNKRSTLAYDNAKNGQTINSGGTSPSMQTSAAEAKHSADEQQQHHGQGQNVGSAHIEVREKQQRSLENLPRAEQQIMDPDFDYYSQRRNTPWNDPYATASSGALERGAHNDDDTMADASANYVMRGRQARVNFITQPKKEDDMHKDIPDSILTKVPPPKSPLYETKYGLASPTYNYDMYPSRSYDPYLRRYDRFDEQYSRYDPYNYEDHHLYRRHYDPYDSYSPRVPQYPEPYYNYPDRRYDIPEPRDYAVSLYNNEVYDKAPYPAASYPTPAFAAPKYPDYALNPSTKYPDYALNPFKYPEYPRQHRRIVYYAHLPEIVRTPYDYPHYNRDRYDGAVKAPNHGSSSAYKTEKINDGAPTASVGLSGVSGGAAVNVDHSYDYMKRDKKDRVTPKPNKLNATHRQ